jgi:transcriptional regulator with XRE-family HTH domain
LAAFVKIIAGIEVKALKGMDTDNNNYTLYLHKNIRCLRKRLNLSQEELANKIGLNRGNISSYENGSAEPKICNLLKLSTLFGVSMMDLTKQDLSKKDVFCAASKNYQQISDSEKKIVEQFGQKAQEIEEVFKGLYTCCRFKTSNLGELPKDTQILLSNFEQLYEAAQTLLCNHKSLLDFIQYRMK